MIASEADLRAFCVRRGPMRAVTATKAWLGSPSAMRKCSRRAARCARPGASKMGCASTASCTARTCRIGSISASRLAEYSMTTCGKPGVSPSSYLTCLISPVSADDESLRGKGARKRPRQLRARGKRAASAFRREKAEHRALPIDALRRPRPAGNLMRPVQNLAAVRGDAGCGGVGRLDVEIIEPARARPLRRLGHHAALVSAVVEQAVDAHRSHVELARLNPAKLAGVELERRLAIGGV